MSLQSHLQPHLDPVERLLVEVVLAARPETPVTGRHDLQGLCAAHFRTGGKRLRGTLPAAIVAEAAGPVEAARVLGACIEVAHNGTLVHDDLQDGDVLRRGAPTLWTTAGMPQAINAGDAMLVAPLLYLLQSPALSGTQRAELAAMLGAALMETIRGQVADVALREDQLPTVAQAAAIARAKTVPLFSCALEGAVFLLGGSSDERAAARRLAEEVGLAFQVRDDLLDVVGTKGRGAAGSDLREGKPTYPILLALSQGPAEEAEELRALLLAAASGRAPSPDEVARWLTWIARQGGVQAARAHLAQALDRARAETALAFVRGGRSTALALCDRLALLDG